ncbi:MAG: hypothetical protein ACP5KN_18295 [Armatimonadota bacterium]
MDDQQFEDRLRRIALAELPGELRWRIIAAARRRLQMRRGNGTSLRHET